MWFWPNSFEGGTWGLSENLGGPLFRVLLHFYDRIFLTLPPFSLRPPLCASLLLTVPLVYAKLERLTIFKLFLKYVHVEIDLGKELEEALNNELKKIIKLDKNFFFKHLNLSKEFDLDIEGTIEME